MISRFTTASTCLLLLLAGASPALADRIDGDWCSPGGKHLRIDGPAITIPSGADIIGDYSRHRFLYEGPVGDPEEGQVVEMQQLSEEAMDLVRTIDGKAGAPERWSRCQAVS